MVKMKEINGYYYVLLNKMGKLKDTNNILYVKQFIKIMMI